MTESLEHKLLKRKKLGNLRQLSLTEGLIDFASNDYLGLARSKKLEEAIFQEKEAHKRYGSTGSRLLTGNSLYAESLEESIAAFHGYEAALLFSCGYMANLGLLSTVGDSCHTIFFDAAVHASTRDGIRLSKANGIPFRHNDLNHLESRLKNSHDERFICIESVYSTDGSKAPLKEILSLSKKYGAHLIVDEAHAIGIYGHQGKGLLMEAVFAQVITFGKALGVYGAAILGSNLLKQALINFSHSYIYTTALPFHAIAAIKCSYDLFPKLDHERNHLQHLMGMFKNATHIQKIGIKGNDAVRKIAEQLNHEGFDARPLMSPTVRRGHEILRICLHSFNTEDEVTKLINTLRNYTSA